MTDKPRDDSRGNLTEMRGLLPVDLVERPVGQPFAPAPGLLRRRGRGGVQPLPLLNGVEAFLVTGFDEARVPGW